jgi:D-beta-D-heptose 7-phosphate kinase/D-beta-D-heptose 1-phosphate adenosyltransferase
VLAAYEAELERADVVILSDYAKGLLSDTVLRKAIALAGKRGVPVVADPKSRDFARYRGVTLLLPNAAELTAATDMPCTNDEQACDAADAARRDCGLENILVTRSGQGMSLVSADGDVLHLPARAREVHDVSGAGDTVAATVAVALAAGLQLEDAARLANVAAGLVVAKVGTATVYPEDLVTAIQTADVMSVQGEIVTLARALEKVESWRTKGLSVGFTNGCFDLLHPGHVSLLREARATCDRLIVGLNSDDSVRRLKGPERPIQNETARSIVLASLGAVDLVVLFDEDTPIDLIEAIKPNVLIKGAHYDRDEVVGADVVQGYGGKVVLAKIREGYSTTRTLARVGANKLNPAGRNVRRDH